MSAVPLSIAQPVMLTRNGFEVRYNLGAGARPMEGYDNRFDAAQGREAYPLALPDDSADEIRASHIFEHFGHGQAAAVLRDWVRVLKPGGLIKLAVPDLDYIARGYLEGRQENWQGFLCGGQTDAHDLHRAQYDEPSLGALMRQCGLVGVHRWKGDGDDCSTLPVSLNLAAWKAPAAWPKVIAVMSVPRLGFMDNFFSAVELLAKLRIPVQKTQGAFWGQCLTRAITTALADGAEWVLTLDYDSVFDAEVVKDLLATAILSGRAVDALMPLQMSRMGGTPLMTVAGENGEAVGVIDRAQMDDTLLPVMTGHFGCTLLKASALARTPRPWFLGVPDAEGGWGAGRVDDDIHFWQQWKRAGNRVFCAPRCVIGHIEQFIIWPDRNLETKLQHSRDYWSDGQPLEVWR